jgi:hypothetical protein
MTDDLAALERSLWLEGADRFRALMAESCLMIFPEPIGILRGGAILRGLEGAPRWVDLTMGDLTLAEAGDAVAALAYRAEARRAKDPPYRALCASTWIRGAAGWRILSHQQTPIPT